MSEEIKPYWQNYIGGIEMPFSGFEKPGFVRGKDMESSTSCDQSKLRLENGQGSGIRRADGR